MKKVLLSSFFVLTFCCAAFGQEVENPPCPTISVYGPNEITPVSKPIIFTVKADKEIEKLKPIYKWELSQGKIIEGQGTTTIKVLQEAASGMTALVTIEGLPKNCINTASVSLYIDHPVQNLLLDDFSISPLRIAKERLDLIANTLRNAPNSTAYLIENFNHKTSRPTIEKKLIKTFQYLVENWKIDAQRITVSANLTDENSTRLYNIPAGASPPDCENCMTAKFTKTKSGIKVSLQPESKEK